MPTRVQQQAVPISTVPASNSLTTVTLQVGGVSFCLTPTGDSKAIMGASLAMGGTLEWKLESFTGTLSIVPSASGTAPISSATTLSSSITPAKADRPAPTTVSPGATTGTNRNKTSSLTRVSDKKSMNPRKRPESTPVATKPITKKVKQTTLLELSQTVAESDASESSQELEPPKTKKASVRFCLDEVPAADSPPRPPVVEEDSENTTIELMSTQEIRSEQEKEAASLSSPPRRGIGTSSTAQALASMSPPRASHLSAPPTPRWGHTLTEISPDQWILYGGQALDEENEESHLLSDVLVYQPSTQSWNRPCQPAGGEARQWHSATFVPDRQLLICFGGETVTKGKGANAPAISVATDTLKVLDTDIMLWYPPVVSGDIPKGRSGHSATYLPSTKEMVIWGGVRGSTWVKSNVVSVLNTQNYVWTAMYPKGSPPPKPRSYHSATAVPKPSTNASEGDASSSYWIVFFGGNNQTQSFDTVHVLETTPDGNWQWFHPSPLGPTPAARTGHTAALLPDQRTICISGGWDPNDDCDTENFFADRYLLDTQTWTWTKCAAEDEGARRAGHASVWHAADQSLVSFGGRLPGGVLAGDLHKFRPEVSALQPSQEESNSSNGDEEMSKVDCPKT